MRSILIKYLRTALVTVAFVSCTSQWDDHIQVVDSKGKTLMEVLSENPQTTIFASIVEKAGYGSLLSGDKTLTVFAPVNEALSNVDMNDLDGLRTIVKSHVAYSNQAVIAGAFGSEQIEMINTKSADVTGLQLNSVDLVTESGKYNITTRNGVLHLMNGMIPYRKNIWEYLQAQSDYKQVDFIKAQDHLIMDMQKSVQIGIASNGLPLYDTVWVNQNKFLNEYSINDETQNYTFILLPNSIVERIEGKYAKYFAKTKQTEQDSIVRVELIKDCVLFPVIISSDGGYYSIDSVLIDIKATDIQETYNASNGTVYKLSDADVKVYENKVKPIIIQGEDYFDYYADALSAWSRREKSYLSGGKDMMMNSRMTFVSYMPTDTLTYTNIYFYGNSGETYTGGLGKVNNCYIRYKPTINSVPYKVYWYAYDDFAWHSDTAKFREPTKFSQKMLISFPDYPVVGRTSNASIENNFTPSSCLTSSTRFIAGKQEEKQLYRCTLTEVEADIPYFILRKNTAFTSEDNYFIFYNSSDTFGDKETIISPTYGEATIMVANTTEYKSTYCGPIIVDYIKLIPIVDPNE
ncbi:MAG: fasciclin domain-containing protein [Paludibacteraceae bacterium]